MNSKRNYKERVLYADYSRRSKFLSEALKDGRITQEEFDYEHEMLDEKFNSVR